MVADAAVSAVAIAMVKTVETAVVMEAAEAAVVGMCWQIDSCGYFEWDEWPRGDCQ